MHHAGHRNLFVGVTLDNGAAANTEFFFTGTTSRILCIYRVEFYLLQILNFEKEKNEGDRSAFAASTQSAPPQAGVDWAKRGPCAQHHNLAVMSNS